MDEIQNEIIRVTGISDYEKGLNYDEDYIKYVGVTDFQNKKKFQFLVHSESSSSKYLVQVFVDYKHISSTFCTCPRFYQNDTCKHVAACLITYSDKIFVSSNPRDLIKKTRFLFGKINKEFEKEKGKKECVQVIPSLVIEPYYYRTVIQLKVKIGIEKYYSLLGKYSSLQEAMKTGSDYKFGTNFTFDSNKHYFDSRTLSLFRYIDLANRTTRIRNNSVELDDEIIKEIIELYPEGISINESVIKSKIKKGFPLELSLTKDKDNYHLKFIGNIEDIELLTQDYEYVYYNQLIYHLNKKQQMLLEECIDSQMSEFVFTESEFTDFQKGFFRIIKDQIVLDESVKDIVIITKPDVKFYFDINEDSITCIPKFLYQNEEISYFDERTNLVKDIDYEHEVVSILYEYGFHKMNHLFLLDDFDLVCEFLEDGLEKISEKYPVFTSENMKNTNIIKKSAITTHFSIGQDQILHYEFDLGNISNEDLDGVLFSLKSKKKYYRLKSGNILSLEQKELQELNDLAEELELSKDDLEVGSGVIPKYRALYLDSLKEKKYGIIKTDSLFQSFINQFTEFKNVELSFTEDEKNLLRDYQVDGVKWLYTICKCGFGGILADEMGLGKSLQTIIFIKKLLNEDVNSKYLIVCPTSLVYNWENEFRKFASDLQYQVFAGNRAERRELLEKYQGNIFITSYGLLKEDNEYYQKHQFKVFVIDEAQNIKNPKTDLTKIVKTIISETKIALTGTPIENSIVELWSIFDFIMPGFLSSLVKFQTKYKIKEFDEETNKILANLKNQVKPFILRRKKTDVIKDLPDKIENNIYLELPDMQKAIYLKVLKESKEEMDELIQAEGFQKARFKILQIGRAHV